MSFVRGNSDRQREVTVTVPAAVTGLCKKEHESQTTTDSGKTKREGGDRR